MSEASLTAELSTTVDETTYRLVLSPDGTVTPYIDGLGWGTFDVADVVRLLRDAEADR